jgi:hypothetical protein
MIWAKELARLVMILAMCAMVGYMLLAAQAIWETIHFAIVP